MAFWSSWNNRKKAAAGGGAALVLALLGYLSLAERPPAPGEGETAISTAAPEPEAPSAAVTGQLPDASATDGSAEEPDQAVTPQTPSDEAVAAPAEGPVAGDEQAGSAAETVTADAPAAAADDAQPRPAPDDDRAADVTAAADPVADSPPQVSTDQAGTDTQIAVPEPGAGEDTDRSPAPTPPSFDIVRVDAEGNALVAGRAMPGSLVELLLDGKSLAEETADQGGTFVAMTLIPPSPLPQSLSLRMSSSGHSPTPSEQTVLIAPARAGADVPVSEAAPELAGLAEDAAPNAAPGAAPPPALPASPGAVALPGAGDTGAPVGAAQDLAPRPQTAATSDAVTVPEGGQSPEARPGSDGAVAVAEAPLAPAASPSEGDAVTTGVDASGPDQPQADTAAQITQPDQPGVAEVDPAREPPAAGAEEAPATTVAAAPAVILTDPEGVRVLQQGGETPQALASIALDSISYDDAGDVTLAGRGTGTGFVRIYLNNNPVHTQRIAADGSWRTPLPQVDTGVYTLRLDEVDEEGQVVSRVETPFKREEPGVLAAALERQKDADPDNPVTVVTVQKGNTLWGISRERYGRGILYVHVFDANRDQIRDPHWIYPGQVFALPSDSAVQE